MTARKRRRPRSPRERNLLRFKYIWRDKVKAYEAKLASCKHTETKVVEVADTEYRGSATEGDREIRCTSCGRLMGWER